MEGTIEQQEPAETIIVSTTSMQHRDTSLRSLVRQTLEGDGDSRGPVTPTVVVKAGLVRVTPHYVHRPAHVVAAVVPIDAVAPLGATDLV